MHKALSKLNDDACITGDDGEKLLGFAGDVRKLRSRHPAEPHVSTTEPPPILFGLARRTVDTAVTGSSVDNDTLRCTNLRRLFLLLLFSYVL